MDVVDAESDMLLDCEEVELVDLSVVVDDAKDDVRVGVGDAEKEVMGGVLDGGNEALSCNDEEAADADGVADRRLWPM